MWRQKHLSKSFIEELPHRHRLVHTKVVHYHDAVTALALLPQCYQEFDEGLRRIDFSKRMSMKESS